MTGERKSLSFLLMVSRGLTKVLKDQYPTEPQMLEYLDQLTALSAWESRVPVEEAPASQLYAPGTPGG